jgi:signal transduction histidine kinase
MPAIPVAGFVLEASGAAVLALILRRFQRQIPRVGVPEWSLGLWCQAAALLASLAVGPTRPLPAERWPLLALTVVLAYWGPALVLAGTWARWNERDIGPFRPRLLVLLTVVGAGTTLASAASPDWGPALRLLLRTLLTAAAQLAASVWLLRAWRRRPIFGTRILGFAFLGLATENVLFAGFALASLGGPGFAPGTPTAEHLIQTELLLLMLSGVGMVAWLLEEERESALRLQEVLQRREALSLMGALVAGVAHEVRNPLFGISSTLDAFEARAGGDAGATPYLKNMREQVARLGDLMTELLDYGRPISAELASEPLPAVVAEAIQSCAPQSARAAVAVEMEQERDETPVRMDRPRLRQVFQNLVQNAVEHTPPGGRVLVRVQRETHDGQPGVRCSVRDSGPGFDPADLPRVFEPFFTRRRGGTGLGLSIVQRIVEQHSGRAWAANHPEGGGLVSVWLPAGPS